MRLSARDHYRKLRAGGYKRHLLVAGLCILMFMVGFWSGTAHTHMVVAPQIDGYSRSYFECSDRAGKLSEELRLNIINLRDCERYVRQLKDER